MSGEEKGWTIFGCTVVVCLALGIGWGIYQDYSTTREAFKNGYVQEPNTGWGRQPLWIKQAQQ